MMDGQLRAGRDELESCRSFMKADETGAGFWRLGRINSSCRETLFRSLCTCSDVRDSLGVYTILRQKLSLIPFLDRVPEIEESARISIPRIEIFSCQIHTSHSLPILSPKARSSNVTRLHFPQGHLPEPWICPYPETFQQELAFFSCHFPGSAPTRCQSACGCMMPPKTFSFSPQSFNFSPYFFFWQKVWDSVFTS